MGCGASTDASATHCLASTQQSINFADVQDDNPERLKNEDAQADALKAIYEGIISAGLTAPALGPPEVPPPDQFTPLVGLPECLADLHDGMPPAVKQAPMRLIKLSALLTSWNKLKVYEEVDVGAEGLEVPYKETDDDLWRRVVTVSWRWAESKPAELQPGFSPMSYEQFQELKALLSVAADHGIDFVWIDWSCVPQYSRDSMVEVHRSKVFYARSRAMYVLPTFHPLPEGPVRLILARARRVLSKHAEGGSAHCRVAAAVIGGILEKNIVAGREYFGRVWTLAERMARYGRGEGLWQWLSLEAWLGMLIDAMLKSMDDKASSQIYKKMLGGSAARLLDEVLAPLAAAMRIGGVQARATEGLETKVAELCKAAVEVWMSPSLLAEAPTRKWLHTYLGVEATSGVYQAFSEADRVWAIYSYFSWNSHLDRRSAEALATALEDLVETAGGDRRDYEAGMFAQLGIGGRTASEKRREGEEQQAAAIAAVEALQAAEKERRQQEAAAAAAAEEKRQSEAAAAERRKKEAEEQAEAAERKRQEAEAQAAAAERRMKEAVAAATAAAIAAAEQRKRDVEALQAAEKERRQQEAAAAAAAEQKRQSEAAAAERRKKEAEEQAEAAERKRQEAEAQAAASERRMREAEAQAAAADQRRKEAEVHTARNPPAAEAQTKIKSKPETSVGDAASVGASATTLVTRQPGHADKVHSVTWSPDGRKLASGSADRSIRVWEATSGACVATLQGHEYGVNSVAWGPDGRKLASGGSDDSIRVWDAASGACVATLEGHTRVVTSVTLSPDGRKLASGSVDRSIRVWDAASGACVAKLQGHADWVNSVTWSPDGWKLASGSADRSIRVWDAASGACVATLQGHRDLVFSVTWSPDGQKLASGSADSRIRVWDATSGACVATLQGHTMEVHSVTWSPDGRKLASGSADKSIQVWDATSGACVATLQGHKDSVYAVTWSPDGRKLASGSKDKSIRVWDATSGVCIATL